MAQTILEDQAVDYTKPFTITQSSAGVPGECSGVTPEHVPGVPGISLRAYFHRQNPGGNLLTRKQGIQV